MFVPKLFGALCAFLAVSSAVHVQDDILVGGGNGKGLLGGSKGPEKVVAQKKFWKNKFVPFAMYISHTYRYISKCPDPAPFGAEVVQFFSVKNTSTQAVLYRNDAAQVFVLSFPGTSNERDLITDKQRIIKVPLDIEGVSNKDCRACQVHHGFQDAWQSVQYVVAGSIYNNLKNYPDYKVTVIGHSLGASLACLATAGLHGQGFPVNEAVTFGQPRTGNHPFAKYIDQITFAEPMGHGTFYRVTHANDDVPHHPSRVLGYIHHSTEFWEVDNDKGKQSAKDTYMCFGQECPDCNDGTKAKHFIEPAHLVYSNQDLSPHQKCQT